MPAVFCSGCGRQLEISLEEQAAGITLECARCNTGFRVPGAATAPPPVQGRATLEDDVELEAAPQPLNVQTFFAPGHLS
jgi:hypothetical protein